MCFQMAGQSTNRCLVSSDRRLLVGCAIPVIMRASYATEKPKQQYLYFPCSYSLVTVAYSLISSLQLRCRPSSSVTMGGGICPPGARKAEAAKSPSLSKAESSGSESSEKDSDSGDSAAVNQIAESDRTCTNFSGKCYRHEELHSYGCFCCECHSAQSGCSLVLL
jgi:hypothetical protein